MKMAPPSRNETRRHVIPNFIKWSLPWPIRHRIRLFRYIQMGYGEPEIRLIPKLFARGDVAIDIGANIGMYSHALARCATTVLSFEPDPTLALYLRKVLSDRCHVFEYALSDADGETTLRVPIMRGVEVSGLGTVSIDNDLLSSANVESIVERKVEMCSLDSILARPQYCERRVEFIKIDVEGHELSVVKGALQTISRNRPILLIETEFRHGAPVEQLFSLFSSLNYSSFIVGNGGLVPIDAVGLKVLQSKKGLIGAIAKSSASEYVNNVIFKPTLSLA